MTKKLIKELVAELRNHKVTSTYSAEHGWDKPFEHNCDLCGAKWAAGKPEKHKAKCLLVRADKAAGNKPCVVPFRPLSGHKA